MLPIVLAPAVCAAAGTDLFETRVRPVLARSCYACHGPEKQLSGLRVDSRAALVAGGRRGPALTPGKPEESLLVKAVRHEGLEMPLGGTRLRDADIAAIEEWIRGGAVWPAGNPAPATGSVDDRFRKLAAVHWAFRPLRAGSALTIDEAIGERLRQAGLAKAAPAPAPVLRRRLSYVLTGLPPSGEPAATYEAEVDRMLSSPRLGEHWARHWMDLMRYGETRGYEWNYEITGAWHYRDYLIRAFNADVPYDQLVREHIAGDLLARPRVNHEQRIIESPIGTAFYRLGEAGHDDCIQFREIALDVVDNQIDTLTKAFLGLTVSCARCHDHKIDPVGTVDYYSLYSILNSSRPATHTIDTPEVSRSLLERLEAVKAEIRREMAGLWLSELKDLPRLLRAQEPGGTASGLDPDRVRAWHRALARKDPKMEDPAHAWQAMVQDAGGAAARYRAEAAGRAAFNRENFEPFPGWQPAGLGIRASGAGEFAIEPFGPRVITGVYPGGVYTHTLSQKLNGAWRSPVLPPKRRKFVSVRAMGGSLASRRAVVDNCAIGEGYRIFEADEFSWHRMEVRARDNELPVYLELLTRSDNPRIPDRPGMIKDLHLLDSPRSYFGFAGAVMHDVAEPPRESLTHLERLFEAPGTPAERFAAAISQAVERWARGEANDDDARWLDWMVRNGLLANSAGASPRLAGLVDRYRMAEQQLAPPRVVEGLADAGPGRDFPVLLAGNPKAFGDPAPRRLLRYLFGDEPFATTGSGRLELANALVGNANPLTARVMVNRVWGHIFGRGLVATADNFGILGDRPSHPELLDALAARFIEQGWSVKKLIREMVLSDAFRRSSDPPAGAASADPANALLSHYPLRRLSGEQLRDSILAASGSLRTEMYGPSVDPYRDKPQDYRRLFSGPLDGNGRRSVYIKITRMEGPRFLEIFDYPSPMAARGARDVTNVPSQALAMLNDPFVLAEAGACARRLVESGPGGLRDRVRGLFLRVLGREPSEEEAARFGGLAAELASLHRVPRDQAAMSVEVWKDVAHALFNLKEFLYLQ